MKLKLVALTLIAFACWLVPFKTLAEETRKTETKVEVTTPTNVPSRPIEPNKPVLPPTTKTVAKPSSPSTSPKPSGRRCTPQALDQCSEDQQSNIQIIIRYSNEYGISPEIPLAIAQCESGFNTAAKNRNSTASGVYQWLASSWANQPLGKQGVSVFNAEANIKSAVWLIAHGQTSPWNASKSCWK